MDSYALTISLFLLIVSLVLLKIISNFSRKKILLPPSPPKLPVLGNLHQIGNLRHHSLTQLSKKYGPVMFLKLGCIPVVVISSAESAREVLKVHDLDCCSRPPLTSSRRLTYNYLDIGFAPYGEYWREMRKICILELFRFKRVESFRFIREEEVGFLMDSIYNSSSSGDPICLSKKIYALAGNIVLRMAFRKRFGGSSFDNDEFRVLINEVEALLGQFSADEYFPYVGWIFDKITGFHAKLERAFRKLDTFFQEVIDDHCKPGRTKQEEEDIVDVMLKLERDQTKSKDHMKAVSFDILLAGVETTATTLIWAMAELVKNPRVMKKAQDEVRNCKKDQERVNEDDLFELQYLEKIVKETLRLHPPIPLLIARETMSHFKINSFDILPRTVILINAWTIGRDPKYWKNPEQFLPERFMDNSVDFRGQNFEFLPFGAGRRICPGMHMGLAIVKLALANLLYCFDWKLLNGMREEAMNMEESNIVSLSLSKKTPLNLVPIKHLQ